VLAERIGAERAIIAGRGHTIPSIGGAYNSRLHEFLARAEASAQPNLPAGVDGVDS
jgi:hypothetical protein